MPSGRGERVLPRTSILLPVRACRVLEQSMCQVRGNRRQKKRQEYGEVVQVPEKCLPQKIYDFEIISIESLRQTCPVVAAAGRPGAGLPGVD